MITDHWWRSTISFNPVHSSSIQTTTLHEPHPNLNIMPSPENNQALVLGASGITGWAIVKEALSYPTPTTFSRVIGLTSRPLAIEDSGLPKDPRLELYVNLDLSKDVAGIVTYLQAIPEIQNITHVYFAAYVHLGWGASDSVSRARENVKFLTNAVAAIEAVCPNMQFFTFPTGGKVCSSLTVPQTTKRAPSADS
jgi:hypothetical protein